MPVHLKISSVDAGEVRYPSARRWEWVQLKTFELLALELFRRKSNLGLKILVSRSENAFPLPSELLSKEISLPP